jgi:hypothetical protein
MSSEEPGLTPDPGGPLSTSAARRLWSHQLVRGAALLLVLLGAVALWGAVSSGSGGQAPPAAPAAVTAAAGAVRVSAASFWVDGNGECALDPGYGDIPGAQVTVTDPAGKVVGVGRLGAPTGDRLGESGFYDCVFPFTVQVPAGLGIYGFEVSHRGVVQVREAQLAGVQLAMQSR